MTTKTKIIIMRGLPGAGKTTRSNEILTQKAGTVRVSADDFFVINGIYRFNPKYIAQAHSWAKGRLVNEIVVGTSTVIVDNTHSRTWEWRGYLKSVPLDLRSNIQVEIIDLFDGGNTDDQLYARGIHGVPLKVIKNMRERWELWEGPLLANYHDMVSLAPCQS